ncbi:tyrosine-protein phosphatase [Nocardioides donggukensis]|uniref:Tyrosine-protein phosphatase n=1 Tax=Nocardioides donggukensis TaxID=2774019 RepID=A0A927KBC0_9ACTN|nr:tyrosine-protein phosphatase [Nocardioides donggukensis]MBD8871166.1 tyrosine-protein phosphatase [Nocardioides donggukensis]
MTTTELLRLASADNFRDVAGPGEGYPTRDGGRVRRGVFFRSNQLALSPEDAAVVAGLGLTAIHDLRRADEIESNPDVEVPGATWHHHDVLGVGAADAVGNLDVEETVTMMERAYTDFVLDPASRAALGSLFGHLAHDPGPQLFHCTAGKDRTGWAGAVLLELAGVDDEVVFEDYLLSNDYSARSRAGYEEAIREALGEEAVAVLVPVLEVREEYLALSRRLVETTYGGLDGYLREGLGLDEATLTALAGKLRAA